MAKSTRHRRRHRQIGEGRIVRTGHGGLWRLARRPPVDLYRDARRRLAMLDWHAAHGASVSRTARHFGVSRPTVYRWLGRFERLRLETLEDRGSVPRRRRRPTWTVAQIEAVRAIRERYPRWGKAKLRVLLGREGLVVSVSMVGRILTYLRRRGVLREPIGRRVGVRQRRWRRPHAVRLPRDWPIDHPGDLVELDTLDIRPPGLTHPFKQFTARDRVSRWDTLELRANARAQTAASVLDALAERMPFAVRAISVDNGSEFMAEFEAACQARAIRLFNLPPRSPKLHGSVERANRTHTEEFYEVTDAAPELEALQVELAAWEVCYNTIRPHQALGYLTPAEYLATLGVEV
jgi:transposase InsO family protein